MLKTHISLFITLLLASGMLLIAGCGGSHGSSSPSSAVTPTTPAPTAGNTLLSSIDTLTVAPGGMVSIPVIATTSQPIMGSDITITYDNAVLSADLKVLPSDISGFRVRTKQDGNTVHIVMVAAEGKSCTKTQLLSVPFFVGSYAKDGKTTIKVTGSCWDSNGNCIGSSQAVNNTITISSSK